MGLEVGFNGCVMPLSLMKRRWQEIIASYNARIRKSRQLSSLHGSAESFWV